MVPHCQQDKELHPQPGHKAAPAQPGLSSAGCVAPRTHGTVVLAVPLLGGPSLSSIHMYSPPALQSQSSCFHLLGGALPVHLHGLPQQPVSPVWGEGGSTEALHSQALGWAGLLGYAGNSQPDALPPMFTVTFQERARGDQSSLGSRGSSAAPQPHP